MLKAYICLFYHFSSAYAQWQCCGNVWETLYFFLPCIGYIYIYIYNPLQFAGRYIHPDWFTVVYCLATMCWMLIAELWICSMAPLILTAVQFCTCRPCLFIYFAPIMDRIHRWTWKLKEALAKLSIACSKTLQKNFEGRQYLVNRAIKSQFTVDGIVWFVPCRFPLLDLTITRQDHCKHKLKIKFIFIFSAT